MKKTSGGANKRVGVPNHPTQPVTDLIALGSKTKDGRGLGNDSSSSYSEFFFIIHDCVDNLSY